MHRPWSPLASCVKACDPGDRTSRPQPVRWSSNSQCRHLGGPTPPPRAGSRVRFPPRSRSASRAHAPCYSPSPRQRQLHCLRLCQAPMGHARALPRPLSLSTSVPQRLPWARRLAPPGPLAPQQSRHCLWEGQGQGYRLWQVTMGQGRGQGQGHRLLQAPMGQGPGPPPSPRTHLWVSHVHQPPGLLWWRWVTVASPAPRTAVRTQATSLHASWVMDWPNTTSCLGLQCPRDLLGLCVSLCMVPGGRPGPQPVQPLPLLCGLASPRSP